MEVMKPWRALLSLYLGFLLGCLLLFFFSGTGLRSYRALTAYRDLLQSNLRELEELHETLAGELDALRTEPERIVLEAREIGYFREQDRVIRLDGREPGRFYQQVGRQVLRQVDIAPRDAPALRILCMALPFGIYTGLCFLSRRGRRWRHAGHKSR